jgi:hypothetical protein
MFIIAFEHCISQLHPWMPCKTAEDPSKRMNSCLAITFFTKQYYSCDLNLAGIIVEQLI